MEAARQHLRVALALAIAGHAALLALPGRAVHPSNGGPDGSPLFTDLRVRLAPAPALPTETPLLEAGTGAPLPSQVAVAPVQAPAAPVPADPPATAPPPWSPVSKDGTRPTEDTGPAEYLTRDQLTAPPRPLSDLMVPFPEQVGGLVDLRVKVGLFIDDAGKVRRVRLDSNDVPPAFVRAIESTFLSARFAPGQRDAVPVPAFIRVEVEFGARPPR